MSRRPHLTARKLTPNQRVFCDPSGVINGYHASVCRGYWVGEAPPEFMVRSYKPAAGITIERG